ncbi:glycosyltransferase [Methanofollis tationis]|uniref:Glycosyltransferase n=1 Tax=Methanofollis tationis TaxID=81417 RepID=A0A7K4HNN0_9EURY|nr:glycosyltransferase [Methanofollis tationis]
MAESAGVAAYAGTFVSSATPGSGEPEYRGKRVAVVVPAYNEEDLIGETIESIPEYVVVFQIFCNSSEPCLLV